MNLSLKNWRRSMAKKAEKKADKKEEKKGKKQAEKQAAKQVDPQQSAPQPVKKPDLALAQRLAAPTVDKQYLLTTKQMAEFVARGFLRFDELVPDEINQA